MPIPKVCEFCKPFLDALKDGNAHTMKTLSNLIAKRFNLSQNDLSKMVPSGQQSVFDCRLGWAKTYLKKAGLIDSPARAFCVITHTGQNVLKDNPPMIDVNYLMRFLSFREFYNNGRQRERLTRPKDINGKNLLIPFNDYEVF